MSNLCDECETVAHCLKHGCIPKVRSTIDMAREAGFTDGELAFMGDNFRRFEALVRADEREQAEERVTDLFADMETPYLPDIIAAIRARGQA
jgi:hypothetical protein